MKKFENRKARHTYFFIDDLEVGVVLTGTEIKSLRQGKINFKDAYARIKDDGIWLHNMHISPYDHGGYTNHDPERPRKLLLHQKEIKKLRKKVDEKGLSLIPKSLYINKKGLVKIFLATAKGKANQDKRETIKERDESRNSQRALKYEKNY